MFVGNEFKEDPSSEINPMKAFGTDELGLELSDKANQPDGASCFVNAIKDFKYDGKISKEEFKLSEDIYFFLLFFGTFWLYIILYY